MELILRFGSRQGPRLPVQEQLARLMFQLALIRPPWALERSSVALCCLKRFARASKPVVPVLSVGEIARKKEFRSLARRSQPERNARVAKVNRNRIGFSPEATECRNSRRADSPTHRQGTGSADPHE